MSKTFIGLCLGLACALIALTAGRTEFVRAVELKTYDLRMRATAHPQRARSDILLVDIDETSIRALEPVVGRWPWPRAIHAYLLDFLARAPAKVVAYDVLFTERDTIGFESDGTRVTGTESDAQLGQSTAAAGMVVHLLNAEPPARGSAPTTRLPDLPSLPAYNLDQSIEPRPVLTPPIDPVARASRALGHNHLVLDPDGTFRGYVPFVRHGDRYVPALGMAAAIVALGAAPADVRLTNDGLWIKDRFVPLITVDVPSFYGERATSRRMLVHFVGGPYDASRSRPTYRHFSFYDLFYSEQQLLAGETPVVDPSIFANKIVMVGTTAPALYDTFAVPFTGKMPGSQIHGAVVDDVLSRRSLRPASTMAAAAVTVGAAAALGLAGVWLGTWAAIALAAAGAGTLTLALTMAFERGLWFPLVEPALGIALATFAGVTYQYVVEGREKRRIKGMFGRYVSKDVYEQLMADPSLARLGGQRREMSVLFSDIRGFTTVSEQGEPEAIVAQLNEYFSRMVPIVFAHRGTVDKFVGDLIMALFGAPVHDPDHAEHAVAAAVAMVRELGRLNTEWAAAGRPTLDIGVGINSGPMVAGNIGSETIMSYTVIGDNVNLGSRLESLNKEYASRIIISDATRTRLKGRYDIRPLGSVKVKGKTQSVDIFEVRVPDAVAEPRPVAGGA